MRSFFYIIHSFFYIIHFFFYTMRSSRHIIIHSLRDIMRYLLIVLMHARPTDEICIKK